MTSTEPKTWFVVKLQVDEPGLIGKAWWHQGLSSHSYGGPSASRRGILIAIGAIGAIAVVPPFCAGVVSGLLPDGDADFIEERRGALELQRQYGWSFGAHSEPLAGAGTTATLDQAQLARLVDDLAPKSGRLRPFYVPTLFESATSTQGGGAKLSTVLRPYWTDVATRVDEAGRGFAAMVEGTPGIAVVVDLDGPDAVAFAKGAAATLDPVFLFDNWPHPKGVVAAHWTLATAATVQQHFVAMKGVRAEDAPPMFVLDRTRLTPYVDDATQFDNRYVAKLPSAEALQALGVSRVLYVTPRQGEELDDLNEDFVAYQARGLVVEQVPIDQLLPQTGGDPRSYVGPTWGGHPYLLARSTFRARFLGADPASLPVPPHPSATEPKWTPRPRASAFSQGNPVAVPVHARPAQFGMVAVVLAASSRQILGAKIDRSGSWNRMSYSYGGG